MYIHIHTHTRTCTHTHTHTHIMEFYSATKKEILLLAGKWMGLENINLSEVTQVQMPISHICSHMWNMSLIQIQ
jgi:hypothetical protein